MLSANLFAQLERRARRVRGASWAAKAWAVTAITTVLAVLAATLGAPALTSLARTALGAVPAAAAVVGYVLGRWPRPQLPGLLLAVDERLGLEARLSALYELARHPGPTAFAARIAADVERLAPRWRNGIPVGRRPLAMALTGAALLAAGFGLIPLLGSPAAPAAAAAASQPTDSASPPATAQVSGAAPQPQEAPTAGESQPSSRATALPARSTTLRDILAELRPLGGASGSPSASGSESEGRNADLRRDLERLSERLDRAPSPLDEAEKETLRSYVAEKSPERRSEVDDAVAASNLDELRQTITQLLAETAPGEEAESSAAISHLAPEASPQDATQETPPPTSPPTGPTAPSSDRTGAGTLGDGSTSGPESASSEPPPVFESSKVRVLPVSPPSVLGASGAYSEYLTVGVPVETPQSGETAAGDVAFNFNRIDSVLSGRNVPDGAVDTIRTYFERITKENP
ncbi:MAG: hypothetical protein NTY63_05475 [Candidatus Bipolaricaulota bacterium]|nr:hypothetical protein [Candidatus Bipolaricaulota bacterium]